MKPAAFQFGRRHWLCHTGTASAARRCRMSERVASGPADQGHQGPGWQHWCLMFLGGSGAYAANSRMRQRCRQCVSSRRHLVRTLGAAAPSCQLPAAKDGTQSRSFGDAGAATAAAAGVPAHAFMRGCCRRLQTLPGLGQQLGMAGLRVKRQARPGPPGTQAPLQVLLRHFLLTPCLRGPRMPCTRTPDPASLHALNPANPPGARAGEAAPGLLQLPAQRGAAQDRGGQREGHVRHGPKLLPQVRPAGVHGGAPVMGHEGHSWLGMRVGLRASCSTKVGSAVHLSSSVVTVARPLRPFSRSRANRYTNIYVGGPSVDEDMVQVGAGRGGVRGAVGGVGGGEGGGGKVA